MCVDDAADIRARRVDGAMNGDPRLVDAGALWREDLAVEVDPDERGRRDLLEHRAERIDQEMLVVARYPRRDMGVDDIVHAVERHQPVAGGEGDARFPLARVATVSRGRILRLPRWRGALGTRGTLHLQFTHLTHPLHPSS